MNIKITLAYDGSCFNGSQKQPNKNTVQDKLDEIFKVIGINEKINFSGRTDKNVHAYGQVVSLNIPHFWHNLSKLKQTLNQHLPNSIVINNIQEVDKLFHARFSAKKRVYRYIISTANPSPFQDKYVHFCKNIDEAKIKNAIKLFKGVHNFKYFSKNGSDPKSTIREIYNIKFYKYQNLYIFKFTANSYLRSQIRMMVSFLLKISQDKLTINDLQNQLNCQKLISWTLAPPNGLYLTKVTYDNLLN